MAETVESNALTVTAPAGAEAAPTVGEASPTPYTFRPRDLTKPLGWYVDWVRSNPEGASGLTRFSRTLAMVMSEPTDLVQMELCWGAAKVHANVNDAILFTANRRVTLSEGITLLLGAMQEVECLMELLVRKYKGNTVAWNAMLGLETVKGLLNLCMHRQLFLVPWIWHSVRLYIRRTVRRVYRLVARSATSSSSRRAIKNGTGEVPSSRALVGGGSNLVGEVAGPGGVRLVIPRVVSDRRSAHTHTYYATEQEGGEAVDADAAAAASGKLNDDDEDDAEAREALEAVHFTWVDVLGMLVDVYLLVRPVALVWAARRSFPKGPEAESIGKPPVLPTSREWADKQDKANKAAAEAAKAQGLPAPKPEKAPPMPTVLDNVMRSTPATTLCGNWRLWGVFVVTDFFVALVSRFIRQHRVPVVYIDAQSSSAEGADGAVGDATLGPDGRPTLPLPTPPTEGEAENVDGTTTTTTVARTERTEVPPVVSRDSLRLQQATRNVAYNFLRDPFFSASLRQFIFDHFVNGFLNRIPLVGAILAYQVSYYLSMQHYSFLYTVGQ